MFRFVTREYIAHLKDEIAYLRMQAHHERQRAEVAIDRLLNQQRIDGVTFPTREEIALERDADPVARLLAETEFVTAGTAG